MHDEDQGPARRSSRGFELANRGADRVPGRSTLNDATFANGRSSAVPGKRSLTESLPAGAVDPAIEAVRTIGRVRARMSALAAAHRDRDPHLSSQAASEIEVCLKHAQHAARVALMQRHEDAARLAAVVAALESEVRPLLEEAFRPSDRTIREAVSGENRTRYDSEAADWKTKPPADAATVASRGTHGGGERLPHFDRIQASFGSHDVSSVRAHVGGAAADASRALGAHAFAFGDHVAFASAPDLHTAAHEAAHIVQQRSGVALKGELDQPGDEYEQHADRVADAVVRGESAATLLDQLAGRGASAGPSRAVVQRKAEGASTSAPSSGKKSAFGMYLYIHEADLRRAVRETLVDVAWPDPAPDVSWAPNGDRLFGAAIAGLVGDRLSTGEETIVQLLQPSDVVEYFHRVIKLGQANWSPEFGLGFAGLVARAAITSLTNRVGPSFQDALARSANVPTAEDLATLKPIDVLVALALVRPGVADLSNVSEAAPAVVTGHRRGKGAAHAPTAPVSKTATADPIATREQLQEVDRKIGTLLDQIRITLQPAGLGSRIAPALNARARRMKDIATGDEGARSRLVPELQFQHAQLITIAPQVTQAVTKFLPNELALKVARDDAKKAARDATWSILSRLVEAVNVSDQRDESAAILRSITDDAHIEADAHAQADVEQATQQVIVADGHSAPGAAATEERTAHQRQATLTGGPASTSKYERQKTETMAGEVALDSRMTSVERALVHLQAAADDAGFMDPKTLRKFVPDAAKTVPELLTEVRDHLSNVRDTQRHATIDGTPAVQEDPNAPEDWTDWVGRAAGLAAARGAFAKIAGEQDIGEFLRECATKIRHQQMLNAVVTLAEALLITLVTGMGAAALGRTAAAAIAAEETSAAATLAAEGASAARAGWVVRGVAVATDIGINVSINSAVQFAQSGGHESLGWSMLENGLMEIFSRGLLHPLRAAQKTAVDEARALSALPHLSDIERAALKRLDFVGTELVGDLIAGAATQWAAHRIVTSARSKIEVTEPFAETVLEQGAAIALGKFFHGKVGAWQAHRAELERTQLGAAPEAKLLFAARDRFYARAKALAESISPDPAEGAALQNENASLMAQEKELFAAHGTAQQTENAKKTSSDSTQEAASKTSASDAVTTTTRRPDDQTKPEATSAHVQEKWRQATEQMASGSVPAADLLPDTKENREGLARLADIHSDETIPPAVRQAFMQDFAERLRAMPEPTQNLFKIMKDIVYSHEGGAKYQRKGMKISNLTYVRDELGGLRRLLSLKSLCQAGTLTPEFYNRAQKVHSALHRQSELPEYEQLGWMKGAQEVVDLIKSGDLAFDPNRDLLPTALIKGMNQNDSAWFFAGADADVSDVRSAQSQLAISGAYLDGYIVVDIPFELALANQQTGHPGAARPTALDLTLDPLGKLNPNSSEPVGRTNPQSPGQVPAREVVLPPLPMSTTTKRVYVHAGNQ